MLQPYIFIRLKTYNIPNYLALRLTSANYGRSRIYSHFAVYSSLPLYFLF